MRDCEQAELCSLGATWHSFNFGENVWFFVQQIFLLVFKFDFSSAEWREQDLISDLHVDWNVLSSLEDE